MYLPKSAFPHARLRAQSPLALRVGESNVLKRVSNGVTFVDEKEVAVDGLAVFVRAHQLHLDVKFWTHRHMLRGAGLCGT